MKGIRKKILLVLMCFVVAPVFAQQKDTVAMFKEFVAICNAFKQLPLQLNMEYKKTSNLPLAEDDTSAFTATFYIQREGAYMSFGDLEQMVNDSMVLMIMHSIKQMVLTPNSAAVLNQLKAVTGPALPDSALEKFREEYLIQKVDKTPGQIQIKHKRPVPGTALPLQEIMLEYDVQSGTPLKIETISRNLVPVGADVEVSDQMHVVVIAEKGRFVIKEDNTSYTYKSITHNTNQQLPQVITDRIMIDKDNNFVPVKAYESYLLTEH